MELPSAKDTPTHLDCYGNYNRVWAWQLAKTGNVQSEIISERFSRCLFFFLHPRSILFPHFDWSCRFEKFSTFLNNFPQIGKWKQLLRNEKKPEPSNPTSSVSHFFYFYSLLQIKRVDSRLNERVQLHHDQAVLKLKKFASLEASWSISISTPCGSVPGPGPVLKNSN